ncbi:MAG: biotin--[acetyl-CoA-carboxylase] ligase, partial [Actinomycetia bacterium]|nr:biotin--[acetyl-CoA-carboxylase] ligase [Actinomycetes bacterium]
STNADLVAAAGATAAGTVLFAERQRAARGRLERGWVSPARAGLTFSALLRPRAPRTTWGWLTLLAGVATRDAVAAMTGLPAALKWPNDLLIGSDGRKAAGILAQVAGDAVVVGIGVNVTTTAAELALPGATSLAGAGAERVDRTELAIRLLAALGERYRAWEAARGDAVAAGLAGAYRAHCATIGAPVRVVATVGGELVGLAIGVDDSGQLLVRADGRTRAIAAGDVYHVRPATG